MDPETMTVDELDAESVRLKGEINAIRDVRRAYKQVRERKVILSNLAQRLGIEVDGLTEEQARALLEVSGHVKRAGDVEVAPGPGTINVRNGAPEVQ